VAERARADRAASDDLDDVRQRLAGRAADAFDRLEDAVSELYALHSVDPDEIRAALEATLADEARADEARAAASQR
jgi:hypothetical protein